jgi:hypothetical protein
MKNIYLCPWLDDRAVAVANFDVCQFKNSKTISPPPYAAASQKPSWVKV